MSKVLATAMMVKPPAIPTRTSVNIHTRRSSSASAMAAYSVALISLVPGTGPMWSPEAR